MVGRNLPWCGVHVFFVNIKLGLVSGNSSRFHIQPFQVVIYDLL